MTKHRDTRRGELLPGTLEMLILKTLSIEPMHGYAIAQHIHKVSKDVLTVEEGSLYPALQRLLLKRWTRGKWITTPSNRRVRVYALTKAGRQQLGIEEARLSEIFAAIRRVMEVPHRT
ncbi:MAG: PadR family transcriptional regulator [Luteitalea sp.]|nr:PadR family transcriptional regulator [Luteitalea sp.]